MDSATTLFDNIDQYPGKSQIIQNIRRRILDVRNKKRGWIMNVLGRKDVIDQRGQGQSIQNWINRNLSTRLTPLQLSEFKKQLLLKIIHDNASAPLPDDLTPRFQTVQKQSRQKQIQPDSSYTDSPQWPPQQQSDLEKTYRYYDTWIQLLTINIYDVQKKHSIESIVRECAKIIDIQETFQQKYKNHKQQERKKGPKSTFIEDALHKMKISTDKATTLIEGTFQMILNIIGDKVIILKNTGSLFDDIRNPLTEKLLDFLMTYPIVQVDATRISIGYDLFMTIFKFFPTQYTDSMKWYIIQKLKNQSSPMSEQILRLMTIDDLINELAFGKHYKYAKKRRKKIPTFTQLRQHWMNGQYLTQGINGKTPLLSAISESDDDLVYKLVVDYHVDVNTPDRDGKTPLTLAIENKNGKIIDFLKTKGAI